MSDINNDLMLAIQNNDINKVKDLISKGADINYKDIDGFTPLMRATARGNEEIVKYLLDKDAKIDIKNNAGAGVIMNGVLGGIPILNLLLKYGADINECDDYGANALHAAIQIKSQIEETGNEELAERFKQIIEFLVLNGCEINKKNKYLLTPLSIAFITGQLDICILLLQNGADGYIEFLQNNGEKKKIKLKFKKGKLDIEIYNSA